MINSYDMIVFSDDWGRHPSSCQHLMKRFLPHNRILWVNSIGMRRPQFTNYDVKRVYEKINSWFKPVFHSETNLWVYSLFSIPFNRSKFVRRWNKDLGQKKIAKVLDNLSFARKISITTVPNACDWVGSFGEAFKIYYCVDDFSEWPGMDRDLILEMEADLLKEIDLFVATSQKIYDSKRPQDKPALLLPHGVDLEHFKKTYNVSHPPQTDLPKPCIGYFGVIDERLDFDLLCYLARKRPTWTWVFMGPVMYWPTSIRNVKNCILLAPVSYDALPARICSFDILFLPYKLNRLSEFINPLKLREYIATGKPVISVDIAESRPYADVIKIGKSGDGLLELFDAILNGEEKSNPEAQWDRLKEETWEARSEMLSKKIHELIGET